MIKVVTKAIGVGLVVVGVFSFLPMNALLGINVLDFTKWVVIYCVFCIWFSGVGLSIFFSREVMHPYFRSFPHTLKWIICLTTPLIFCGLLEAGLFWYTQHHPQWRVLYRNMAAYGNVADIAPYMDDRFDYRSRRPLSPDIPELQVYSPVVSPAYNVNSNGFRTVEFETPKTGYRIGLLGGSTAWGSWVRDSDTISAHLQRHIFSGYGGISEAEVFNLGIEGVGIALEVQIAANLVSRAKFDHLIFYDGINDLARSYLGWKSGQFQDLAKHDVVKKEKENTIAGGKKQLLFKANWADRLKNKLIDLEAVQTIHFFFESGRFRVRTKGRRELGDLTFNKLVSLDVRGYWNQYVKAVGVCETLDIRCDFFIQPHIGHKAYLTSSESRIKGYLMSRFPDYIRLYDTVADALLVKSDGRITDLRDSLQSIKADVFADQHHMTAAGNKAIATAMFRHIKSNGAIPPIKED